MSKDIKQRLVMALVGLPIAFLVAFLAAEFVPDRIVRWTFNGIAVGGIVLVLYYFVQFRRTMRQLDQSGAQAEEWKRRILSVADTTESPDDDLTFDEFCEFEDDKVLAEVVRELERMPSGQRDLKKAYEIVGRRVSKVGAWRRRRGIFVETPSQKNFQPPSGRHLPPVPGRFRS